MITILKKTISESFFQLNVAREENPAVCIRPNPNVKLHAPLIFRRALSGSCLGTSGFAQAALCVYVGLSHSSMLWVPNSGV